MDLTSLPTFLAVVRHKSFTAAARELGVTPSAVSQTVRALEDRVGLRLLERTTRSVRLTEAGARFVDRVSPALSDIEAAFESLDELRDVPSGTLRLSVSESACELVLEPVLASFLAQHPRLTLEIDSDPRLRDIVADGFDAGLRLGETLEPDKVAVRVSPDQRAAIVAAPSYFRTHPKPRHPRDLVDHACINFRWATRGTLYRWEFTEDGREFDVEVTGPLVVSGLQPMRRAALDGVGIAYAFESMVADELREKRLVRVLEPYCPPFPGYFLYYPSRRNVPKKLAALIAFLTARREPLKGARARPSRRPA